jgi:TonB family protein
MPVRTTPWPLRRGNRRRMAVAAWVLALHGAVGLAAGTLGTITQGGAEGAATTSPIVWLRLAATEAVLPADLRTKRDPLDKRAGLRRTSVPVPAPSREAPAGSAPVAPATSVDISAAAAASQDDGTDAGPLVPRISVATSAPADTARIIPADHAGCAPATHPALLRERGIEGRVRLLVQVSTEGRAREVQLLASSGYRLFDEAALAQARDCRFRPALHEGVAVESWVDYPVRFALAER